MYTQGYTYALTQLGLNEVKIARPAPIKALKGLLGGAKTKAQSAMSGMRRKPANLPNPTQVPSTAQMNQGVSQLQASQQHPSTFAPWSGKGPAPAPAPRIDQFESKLKGKTPPPVSTEHTPQGFQRPEVAPMGGVPKAPPAQPPTAVAPIQNPAAKPAGKPAVVSNDKKPGLLSRGAKWTLPAAAIGGSVYAAGAGNPEVPPVAPAQYGAQYAPNYPEAVPTY